jgi:hypothetical protein
MPLPLGQGFPCVQSSKLERVCVRAHFFVLNALVFWRGLYYMKNFQGFTGLFSLRQWLLYSDSDLFDPTEWDL